jgi:KDO2-lipid IV(A) lauroyltransferase
MEKGKGAVCMTGHFGNWEYMGAMVAQHFPMAFLYQPQNNPYADALIRRTREKVSMRSIPRNSLRDILKALRQKQFVAILADQDAGRSGIFVNFMGRPASTAQGPAAFVLKTGAPILFVVSLRQRGGKHLVESEALTFDDLPAHWSEDEKVLHITQRWSEVLEKYIRLYPDHWFWMHRRWKTLPAEEQTTAARLPEELIAKETV